MLLLSRRNWKSSRKSVSRESDLGLSASIGDASSKKHLTLKEEPSDTGNVKIWCQWSQLVVVVMQHIARLEVMPGE